MNKFPNTFDNLNNTHVQFDHKMSSYEYCITDGENIIQEDCGIISMIDRLNNKNENNMVVDMLLLLDMDVFSEDCITTSSFELMTSFDVYVAKSIDDDRIVTSMIFGSCVLSEMHWRWEWTLEWWKDESYEECAMSILVVWGEKNIPLGLRCVYPDWSSLLCKNAQ